MQHILSLVRRCVEDYNMIEAGETVAVGVSGGKDSVLTLAALARLREFYPIPGGGGDHRQRRAWNGFFTDCPTLRRAGRPLPPGPGAGI